MRWSFRSWAPWLGAASWIACGRPAPEFGSSGPPGDDGGAYGASADADGGTGGQGITLDGGAGADGAVVVGATLIDACGSGNAAGLDPAQVQTLVAGASSSGSMRWLYPYADTVFPRGMLAPLFMWDGSAADAIYFHLVSKSFEYRGCLKPTAAGQLQLAQSVWDAAGDHTGGSTDPYSLELSVWAQGKVTGTIRETLVIAPATVKGSIYYNSYSSRLGGGGSAAPTAGWSGGFGVGAGGIILRIPPKKTAEAFATTGCIGCHSLSAGGSRLLAQSTYPGAVSFALTPTTAPNPPGQAAGSMGCFGALYPDGTVYLSTATPTSGLAHCSMGPVASHLVQTDTGAAVAGANVPGAAWMPSFSPDGRWLAFTDGTQPSALAIAAFDRATNTASGQRTVYTEADSTEHPGWPFVLPDDGAVVFERTTSSDYSGEGVGFAGGLGGPSGDLYVTDLQSGTTTLLARAMGFASTSAAQSGTSASPFGSEDVHHNYFPTVSPVAAGGYFWVFFDSLRHYGNLGVQRQLWGTALRVSADGKYAGDPSAPAFYVSGQEFGTGNHRAFTALDPCLSAGASCTAGVDCCGGFCNSADGGAGTCGTPAAQRCAQVDEACSKTSDCCSGSNVLCIAGFCAIAGPIQ
jgi:hypothetical protein